MYARWTRSKQEKDGNQEPATACTTASNPGRKGSRPGLTMTPKINNQQEGSRRGTEHAAAVQSKATQMQTPPPFSNNAFPTLEAASKIGKKAFRARSSLNEELFIQPSTPNYAGAAKKGMRVPQTPASPEHSRSPPSSAFSTLSRTSAQNRLRPPTLLPKVQTGASVGTQYKHHYAKALQLRKDHDAHSGKLHHIYKKWDRPATSKRNDAAKEHHIAMKEAWDEAAESLFQKRQEDLLNTVNANRRGGDRAGTRIGNQRGILLGTSCRGAGRVSGENEETAIDFHGIHAEAAIKFLEQFLLGLKKEEYIGLAYALVGQEHHREAGIPGVGLRTTIMDWLDQKRYQWRDYDGALCIDPLH
ncbi:hypothetical protein FRC19_001536 [Serendipita sp. 401]|nr:hypothetical protein FRC15_008056 [Serendipita sp. 397]KAG8827688.1 hypothetical protein FRC19_001536 [Serendipita sp. 401]KAG9058301.1 hypothetical protein FS842_010671 [Serendipita sp. 407]